MQIKEDNANYSKIISYQKYLLEINNGYNILIIGKTDNNSIFFRIILNKRGGCFEKAISFQNCDSSKIYNDFANGIKNNKLHIYKLGTRLLLYFNDNSYRLDLFLNYSPRKLDKNCDIIIGCNIDSIKNSSIFDLSNLLLNNNDFQQLNKITFKAKILNLDGNFISDLSLLNCENYQFLEKLILSDNGLKTIDLIDKLNFDNLKELVLSNNNIVNIETLENNTLENLEILILSGNYISNISILEKVKFNNLLKLDLSRNKIEDISSLKNVDFDKLIIVNLSSNNITDFSIFEKISLNSLEDLNLSFNNIGKINMFFDIKKLFLKTEKFIE